MSETQAEVQQHRPGESFDVDGKWCTACTCGLRFTGSTPSLAYGRQAKHARDAGPGAAPATGVPARVKVCSCGCGQPLAPRAGGLFRSGHDARFKSALTAAHAAGQAVRHPMTGEPAEALLVAEWLDDRRGQGSFWRDRVVAGHKTAVVRIPRTRPDAADRQASSIQRVDQIMQFQQTRRPAAGDVGKVELRSGTFGAQVLCRNDDSHLQVRLLDGNARGQEIVVADDKFSRARR